jgi:hypothetical protein
MPATSDATVLNYVSGYSMPEPRFSSDGKWVIYQFKLFDLRGNQPVAGDINGPEGIKDLFVEGFSNDGTWAIGKKGPRGIVGEKKRYRVFWDLRASVLAPQLFLTPRDHAPKQMDVFASIMSYGYDHPSINSMLVLDELAKLARSSAGLKLTVEDRNDLLLPENKSATIKLP